MGDIHGVQFNPPPEFAVDEVMVSLRGPSVSGLKDPRMLQKQHPVRPSLIIHRRTVGGGASLEMLCGEICAELVNSIEGMQNLHTEAFPFDDGTAGQVAIFDFPVRHGANVRQFQAMRLDGEVLTTLTLTVDSVTFNDSLKQTYFKALASTRAPQANNPAVPTL